MRAKYLSLCPSPPFLPFFSPGFLFSSRCTLFIIDKLGVSHQLPNKHLSSDTATQSNLQAEWLAEEALASLHLSLLLKLELEKTEDSGDNAK